MWKETLKEIGPASSEYSIERYIIYAGNDIAGVSNRVAVVALEEMFWGGGVTSQLECKRIQCIM